MKAAVCYEFGKPLIVEDVTLAAPGAGEIKVKIAACAICHSDIIYMDGGWGGLLPAVYGHEAAGIVETVGSGVQHLRPGDHVVVTLVRSCGACFHCSQAEAYLCESTFSLDRASPLATTDGSTITQGLRTGAFAEYVVVDASQAVAIPTEVPLDSASLLACGVITGLGAVVNTAAVRPASNIVVIGTGGVGLNSVQGAALASARATIAVDVADSKLEAAKTFGASHTINASKENVTESVKSLTGGRGADYVFVTVGSAKAMEQATTLLRRGGTMVIVGMTASGVTAEFETVSIAGNAQRILGSKMGSVRLQLDVPAYVELYQQGRLKLDELISGRYPLQHINRAIDSVRNGEALRNVIVLD